MLQVSTTTLGAILLTVFLALGNSSCFSNISYSKTKKYFVKRRKLKIQNRKFPDAHRENVLCPYDLTLERHRLMWLYLKKSSFFEEEIQKVLHIAPEQCFYPIFKKQKNLNYTTADMESPIADLHFDLHKIPLEDNMYDVIFCNHVLEHVEVSNKKSIKHTINQMKEAKKENDKKTKKKPYIKNYATPDRLPPAAAMLA